MSYYSSMNPSKRLKKVIRLNPLNTKKKIECFIYEYNKEFEAELREYAKDGKTVLANMSITYKELLILLKNMHILMGEREEKNEFEKNLMQEMDSESLEQTIERLK